VAEGVKFRVAVLLAFVGNELEVRRFFVGRDSVAVRFELVKGRVVGVVRFVGVDLRLLKVVEYAVEVVDVQLVAAAVFVRRVVVGDGLALGQDSG
jgi:hypothetical protein